MKSESIMVLCLILLLKFSASAQSSTFEKTNIPFISQIDSLPILDFCGDFENQQLYRDSILNDFYIRIRKGYYQDLSNDYLIRLLQHSKNKKISCCWWEVLKISDTQSDYHARYSCRQVSAKLGYKVYCQSVDIRTAILFYIHFYKLNSLKIDPKHAFNFVGIAKTNSRGDDMLTQIDYDNLVKLYIKALKCKRKKNHLLNKSNYKWVVEIAEFKEHSMYRIKE